MGVPELVVLVNEQDEAIGTMPKSEVHGADTPLHRGFSVFLFRGEGDLLLQQRSIRKKTWPLVWSNSCCGHPGPGEAAVDAARRRVREELGIVRIVDLQVMLPDYRYRAVLFGVVENEHCPVLVGRIQGEPTPARDEIEAIAWMPWESFMERCARDPSSLSPWCVEEAHLLDRDALFHDWRRAAH